jgi:hypothetical protein
MDRPHIRASRKKFFLALALDQAGGWRAAHIGRLGKKIFFGMGGWLRRPGRAAAISGARQKIFLGKALGKGP